jgi:S1-C subfamily serine protease
MGVPDDIIAELDALPQNGSLKSMLSVLKVAKNSQADKVLREGDLIWKLNGCTVCRFLDLLSALGLDAQEALLVASCKIRLRFV